MKFNVQSINKKVLLTCMTLGYVIVIGIAAYIAPNQSNVTYDNFSAGIAFIIVILSLIVGALLYYLHQLGQ